MKVIFLDIDGVLNSSRTVIAYLSYDVLDPIAVGLLYQLCYVTDAKIVISSTLRLHHDIPYFNEMLQKQFHWEGSPVIGVTPNLDGTGYGHRGSEIQEYLNQHPEIEQYVIFDDDNIDIVDFDSFVHVDREHGLSKANFKQALGHFGHQIKIDALSKRFANWSHEEGTPPNRTHFMCPDEDEIKKVQPQKNFPK
jgi:hypothetical protein